MSQSLFSHDHSRQWPDQKSFPINEPTQGYRVKNIVTKDIDEAKWLIIATGFTSLANLVRFFGASDQKELENVKIIFGFEPDERVSRNQPHYQLTTDIKNYWLKRGVSITLCGPILNLIEKISSGKISFKVIDRLHAKLYVSDISAMLGSSNFSISGLEKLREANIRVLKDDGEAATKQYDAIKLLSDNYYDLGRDYSAELIALLHKLLRDATWEEALARGLAEVLESKWMDDYPAIYQAILGKDLWPTQKIGIARAMNIIRDQGNVLIADPTGSGKTKMTTALAYVIFHWMCENGVSERSNAFIVSPPQVMANWKNEEANFKLFNRIESVGKLSFGTDSDREHILRAMKASKILIIDEAHNFLSTGTLRSKSIQPKSSTHVILSTATPINKRAEDLLRLIQLLDIDNLSDSDLDTYIQLRKDSRKGKRNPEHIANLKKYINQFILRRTKSELNKMIDWDKDAYVNHRGVKCRYPESLTDIYNLNETEADKKLATDITKLLSKLRGVNYLRSFTYPKYLKQDDEKISYLKQRFSSAPALAAFEMRSALRSSTCAIYESLYGTNAATVEYSINTSKKPTGDIFHKINGFKQKLPVIKNPEWIESIHNWILEEGTYLEACEQEMTIYQQIGELLSGFSGNRERAKVDLLIDKAKKYGKVLAFDSTILSLDYFKAQLDERDTGIKVLIATGKSEHQKREVRDALSNDNLESSERIIALCSDAMAESINLPAAKSLILLDMPSVLRIIEQRIGRMERMDSEHEQVHIYWPNDAEEFSLKGDKRMIDILVDTQNLIKSNVSIPQKGVYEKYYKDSLSAAGMIKAYETYIKEEEDWEGVKDTTQYLMNLIDDKHGLISRKQYHFLKDVDAPVKTAISFIESDITWSFFAFRGDAKRSPRWMLIDDRGIPTTDFAVIAERLTEYLKGKEITQKKWSDVNPDEEIRKLVHKLRKHEKSLLPPKKQRALKIGEKFTRAFLNSIPAKETEARELLNNLLVLFNENNHDESVVDFNHFAELWFEILLPALDERRSELKRRSTIITMRDLTLNDLELTIPKLSELYERCQYANSLDEIIASCIIAVRKPVLEI